ncbi:asparagine synthase-related protein [Brevibacterium sp. XM4083]|uniref:asparagine synthase-related protein n=1 Tax=Brevibacterium sp. XM4083 TaxID=2583238 RepID=UPI001126274E|nr:asparagine synthase-related protein [Brevibacterium sp. XM4083]MCM1012852.1 asparagine synthase-related protein [Brevibacterium sp. XM4083]
MALVLVTIPKRTGATDAADPESLHRSLVVKADQFVGPRYRGNTDSRSEVSSSGAVLTSWLADHEADNFAMKKGRWSLTSSPNTASRLLDSIDSRAGSYRYTQEVWGTYMAIIGDRSTDRFYAWNTVPTLEAVHYGENSEYIFISNRPLLVALGLAGGAIADIKLDPNYVREYLNVGYSVSGVTPFSGVKVLPPRTSLSVVGSATSVGPNPKPPEITLQDSEDPRRIGANELADAFQDATLRGIERRFSDSIQLRLSGGLDSRIVLGLLKDRKDLKITAVTQGSNDSEDVMVASELAQAAGIEHIVKHPDFVDSTDFIASLERSIFESQGYIPSESLVAPYANAAPLNPPEVLVSGQWPLFKGVMDKTMTNTLDYVQGKIYGINHRIANEYENALTDLAISEWLASVNANTNMELLYAHARDLRSSRYLQPHTIQADRESQIFYPFTDSQVTAVADALPTRNRVQNITAFLAVSEIWEDAVRIPMAYGTGFRFEANEPLQGISGPHYAARNRSPHPYDRPVVRDPDAEKRMAAYLYDPLQAASQYLVTSERWTEVREYLSVDMRARIDELASMRAGDSSKRYQKKAQRRMVSMHIWRIVLVDLWLARGWLALSDT